MKGMKAPKQGDELKQHSLHACVFFFFFPSLCSTYFQSSIKVDLTHYYQSLFDPDGCGAGSPREDVHESMIK